ADHRRSCPGSRAVHAVQPGKAPTMSTTIHHRVLVIGGGNAGISVAARLRRKGIEDIGLLEPREKHYYQPLWTLVGGGRAPQKESVRSEASVVPQGVARIKDSAEHIDPEEKVVTTATGARIAYDHLVVCPGNQLNWAAVPGLDEATETPAVSSNYAFDLAPRTWEGVRSQRAGPPGFAIHSCP